VNNLVGNALKFTDAGAVTVTVAASPEAVSVAVADTGAGIDASFLPHLFDEFKQESSGLGRQHEGSGLGLTITRGLVELMGGRIAVESAKGAGTTFTVTFPRLGRAAPSPGAPPVPEPERPRVLVVDDNESTLALVERILRDLATIDMAATEEEALALADRSGRAYDLILLDIHLGNAVSGTDVLRQLRAREANGRSAIVAFTAFALPGDRERFLNAGFDGYLGKPFTREEMRALMEEVLPRATPPAAPPLDGLRKGTFVE
jgi:CheY-like chemotaxis protein